MTRAFLIVLPLVFVWVVVTFDIVLRRDLGLGQRIAWFAAVTVLWPSMILYLLSRPVEGRLLTATAVRRENPDRRQRLVAGALERQSGRLSQSEFHALAERLRQGPG